MAMILVVTEISNAQKRETVFQMVKSFGDWMLLNTHCIATSAQIDLATLMPLLYTMIDAEDSLWVFSLSNPWTGHGDPIVEDHLVTALGPFVDWVQSD